MDWDQIEARWYAMTLRVRADMPRDPIMPLRTGASRTMPTTDVAPRAGPQPELKDKAMDKAGAGGPDPMPGQ